MVDRFMGFDEAIKILERGDDSESVINSIPGDLLNRVPGEICEILKGRGLSLQQAEVILAIAKGRLRRSII